MSLRRAGIGLLVLAAALFLSPNEAYARKFDFKNESIATYFKGTYGPSQLLSAPYANSSGAQTTSFDQKIETNYSGEFGVVFSTNAFNLRLAAELLLPSHIGDVKGKDAGGNNLFNLDTKTSALSPMVYIDLVAYKNQVSKFYVGAGAGYSYVKMENIYTFTSTGTTTYSLADFVEKAEAEAVAAHLYAGYEILFVDNCTFVIDGGYRYLKVTDLNHLSAATTFLGDVTRGAKARKHDGNARELDLGGGYVGLAFRFYIGL